MPTIDADATALHGLKLPANTEVVVDFTRHPGTVEVVVTTPGTDAVFWTASGAPATVGGDAARVIPANVVAADSTGARRLPPTTPGGPARAQVRLVSASAATVSVQKG